MSQFFIGNLGGSGTVVQSFVVDSGTSPVLPTGLGQITITGSNGITTIGSTNTITINVQDATDSQKGVVELATNAETISGSSSTLAVVPSSLNAKLGAQTANSIPYGQGSTSATGWSSALSNGQLMIGSTGNPPAAANLSSSGSTIAITNGSNSINLETGAVIASSYTTNSGSAVPSGGVLQVLGGTNMNTAGATNVVTINLDSDVTGLTLLEVDKIRIDGDTISTFASNNSITIDPDGSGDIILTTTAGGTIDLNNLRIDSNTISSINANGNIILDPNGTGKVRIDYGTQYALPYFEASGEVAQLGPMTSGQILIGATGGAPAPATITSAVGTINITNGPNSINLETGSSVSTSFTTDAGTATPSSGVLQIDGGTNINTSGAGNQVVVNLDNAINVSTSVATPFLTSTGILEIYPPTGSNLNIGKNNQTGILRLGQSTAGQDTYMSSEANTGSQTIFIASGASAADSTVNILAGAATAGTQLLNLNTGTGSVTRTTNIGTGASVINSINIGGTGANVIAIGNTQTGGSLSLGAAMTTGTISIGGSSQTGQITLGSSTAGQTVEVLGQNNTGPQVVTIAGGASAADSTVNIFTGNSTAGTQTFNLFNGTRAGTTNIATGSAAHAVNIGSTSAGNIDVTSLNDITLKSVSPNSDGIVIETDGGASETLVIRSNQGTNSNSVQILSTVGGLTLQSGFASPDAINLVATSGGIDIDSVTGSSFAVSGAGQDLDLTSSAGSINITAGESISNAIVLSATGTNGSIQLTPGSSGKTDVTTGDLDISGGALIVDPGAATDSYIQYDESTTGKWRVGNDATDDSYRLSQGSALGTNDTFIMTSSGERTMPLQPAFLAQKSSDQTNATGNGTTVTINYANEIFDQNSDYDGTNTFTAPVSGNYYFYFHVAMSNMTASATSSQMNVNTSNRSYLSWVIGIGAIRNFQNNMFIPHMAFCDMDAADTCVAQAFVFGEGADTINLAATGGSYAKFGGYLVC